MIPKKINSLLKLKKKTWKRDAIYNSFWLSQFINNFILHGKKIRIENIIYSCFYKNRILFNLSVIYLFFEVFEFTKNVLDLILAKKNIGANQTIYPKPLQFLDQYKKLLKAVTLIINQRFEFNLKLKLKGELLGLLSKKSSLYLKKENLEKLSVKNRSLKHYRWQI